MNWSGTCAYVVVAVLAWIQVAGVAVADGGVDVGLRANIVGGTGEPANDILGAGVFGRYRFKPRWWVGLAIDYSQFDVERP